MSKRLSYTAALALLGAQVDAIGGADVLVQELTDGFVLLSVTAAGQQVACVSWADLHTLADQHASLPRGIVGAPGALLPPLQQDLQAVGRYLDARQAGAIMVQEWSGGYHVTYEDPCVHDGAEALDAPRHRVTVTLRDADLHAH